MLGLALLFDLYYKVAGDLKPKLRKSMRPATSWGHIGVINGGGGVEKCARCRCVRVYAAASTRRDLGLFAADGEYRPAVGPEASR